jgi:hypothetical protein
LPRRAHRGLHALLTSTLLLAATTSDAAAFCRLTTEAPSANEACSGEGTALHWDRACISYSLAAREQTTPDFESVRDAVDRSFGSWEAVECPQGPLTLSLRQTAAVSRCTVPEHNPGAGNSNSVIFLEDWDELGLPQDAFGLTLIWHSPDSGEIFDADMQLNETMGSFAVCDGRCAEGEVDLENVITHEAGHFLGLGHSRVATAAMYGESSVGETRKRILGRDDVMGICAIFPVGQPRCETSDYSPRGGLEPDCFEPTGSCAIGGRGVAPPWSALLLVGLALALRRARNGGRVALRGRRATRGATAPFSSDGSR